MPCSFIASDFHTPSNITASKDILILFVLELLIIQINNLDGRDPGSLKFPNSVIFFEGLIPQTLLWGNLTKDWNGRLRIRNLRLIFLTERVQSPRVCFPSCSSAIRKSASIFTVGAWTLMKRIHALQMRATIRPLGALMLLQGHRRDLFRTEHQL